MPAANNSNELHLSRIYEAPVQAVWDAWTDPAQVAQWWGPRGFTITTHSKDLRPGGHWNYTMHGPDGVDYPNSTTYHEVVPCERLVYDHGAHDDRPPLFRVTVRFRALDDARTEMDMTMALDTPEAAAQIRKFIRQAGGEATWDRLAEYLARQSSGTEQFVINRSFEASPELLFDLWTDPEHLRRWLPPTGFEMRYHRAQPAAPGVSNFWVMTGPGGIVMHGRVEFQKVERPRLLVYTQQFCDADENLARHPMAPTWPATMLTRVEFTAEDELQTRVTVTWQPWGATTAEELAAFIQERGGMTLGWTGSFDKLEALLAAGA